MTLKISTQTKSSEDYDFGMFSMCELNFQPRCGTKIEAVLLIWEDQKPLSVIVDFLSHVMPFRAHILYTSTRVNSRNAFFLFVYWTL